jgi:hypothetical protein
MTVQTEAQTGTRTAPVDLVFEGEIILDAPVAQAWPHVLNYPSWQNYSNVEHVSGTPGGVGEVVLLHKEEAGFEFPPYYARTLKLVPERQVIWKTYPEKPAEGNDFFGIVDFKLEDAEGKTRFSYHTIYEFVIPFESESELSDFADQQKANFGALFDSILPKLQELVASGA